MSKQQKSLKKAINLLIKNGPLQLIERIGIQLRRRKVLQARASPEHIRYEEDKFASAVKKGPIVDGLIECPILDFKMKLRVTDPGLSRELIVHGIREEAAVRHLRRVLPGKERIVEIGANIGFFALQEAVLTSETAMILAIEPHPDNIELLQKNISLNGFGPKFKVFQLAVSDKPGTANLFVEPRSNWHHLDSFKEGQIVSSQNTIQVAVTSVDEICRQNSWNTIDLLRMDVEGHEYAAIAGAQKMLRDSKKCSIFMEIHPDLLLELGKDPIQLLRDIRDLGFRCSRVCGSPLNEELENPEWEFIFRKLNIITARYGTHMFFEKGEQLGGGGRG